MKRLLVFASCLVGLGVLSACSGAGHASDSSDDDTATSESAVMDVALYRLYKPYPTFDHFYTTNWSEVLSAQNVGYTYQGIAGWCERYQVAGTAKLHRAWKQSATDHFYTYDTAEFNNALANGYVNEDQYMNPACYVYTAKTKPGTCQVFRSFSVPYNDHHYTQCRSDVYDKRVGYTPTYNAEDFGNFWIGAGNDRTDGPGCYFNPQRDCI